MKIDISTTIQRAETIFMRFRVKSAVVSGLRVVTEVTDDSSAETEWALALGNHCLEDLLKKMDSLS